MDKHRYDLAIRTTAPSLRRVFWLALTLVILAVTTLVALVLLGPTPVALATSLVSLVLLVLCEKTIRDASRRVERVLAVYDRQLAKGRDPDLAAIAATVHEQLFGPNARRTRESRHD